MALSNEISSSLRYLRKRYRVSESDLVALARKLSAAEEQEESYEELTREYLRKKRYAVNRKR